MLFCQCCVKLIHLIHPTFLSQLFRFFFMGSFVIISFIVIDDKLSKSSASNAVLVSQSEATKSQLSSLEIAHKSLEIAHKENKIKLEYERVIHRQERVIHRQERVIHRQERVIHRQALDEAEAKARETEGTKRKLEARAPEIEGVLEVFRSEINGLHEGTKELRKVEKDMHMVEMEEMEEADSARKLEVASAGTICLSAVEKEPVVKYSSPSLDNRSRKRTR